MCCKNSPTRIVTFALALALGVSMSNVFQSKIAVEKAPVAVSMKAPKSETFGGSYGSDSVKGVGEADNSVTNTVLKILSKPQARYTDAARANNVQGTVMLKVVFTAGGTVGSVQPVTVLPDGLTEQAILAARQIKFEPARRNGAPVSIVKTVQYSFTIY